MVLGKKAPLPFGFVERTANTSCSIPAKPRSSTKPLASSLCPSVGGTPAAESSEPEEYEESDLSKVTPDALVASQENVPIGLLESKREGNTGLAGLAIPVIVATTIGGVDRASLIGRIGDRAGDEVR